MKIVSIILTGLFMTSVNGQVWGPDVRLTNDPAQSYISLNNARCVAASGNNIHVVWYDERDGNAEIYYKHGEEPPQPDNQIKNSDETVYVGDNIYNLDGTAQTKIQTVNPGIPAVYHIKIENDGFSGDSIKVRGTGDDSGWSVRYYDALTGGADITADVTDSGWPTGSLQHGDSKEIRVEVTPSISEPPNLSYEILVTSFSANDTTKKDAVKAVTTCRHCQPDNQIKNSGDIFYIGDNIYNFDGTNQVEEQRVSPEIAAVYHIKIENDGNVSDKIVVTGSDSSSGWDVKYYDALTGGSDITAATREGGWSTSELSAGGSKEIRVEVTPTTAPDSSSYEVLVTSTSDNDDSKKDVVKAITTVQVGIEEIAQIPKNYFLHTFSNPFGNRAVIKYGLLKKSRISLLVCDIKGSIVRTLTRAQNQEPGAYTVVWDGCNEKGMRLPNGIYFYQLRTKNSSITKKMMLMR